MIKKILLSLFVLVVLLGGSLHWLYNLLDRSQPAIDPATTLPTDLAYIQQGVTEHRGRILAVVTSTDTMGASGKSTGYELTELSRAYWVFTANGFEVDIASTAGGEPPVVIDNEDMGPYDYAFLNDAEVQGKVQNSIAIADVNPADYEGVYFVGGKGAMWDFPDNPAIQNLVRAHFEAGKVVGAICHGPAALVNVTLSNGQPLVEGRQVSSFTNAEELFLIPDAEQVFPFLLQSGLEARGAQFQEGKLYLEQIAQDENLVTAQNPWSIWQVAETMVTQLGYEPLPREITPDEHSVDVLITYAEQGFDAARAQLESLASTTPGRVNRNLIAMHGIVAAMQGDAGKSVDMVRLTAAAKSLAASSAP